MSELAIVSARPARLAALVEKKVTGSRRALALASDPGKFLSTVQIGITLIGVLSGAFSGATLGQRLTAWLIEAGLSQGIADAIGVGSVVGIITYASLIVGELVPKQIALRDPEAIAVRVAPAMMWLAKASLPLVWLLDRSGKLLLWLLGQRGAAEEKVSEEEIRTLVVEAENAGVLEPGEKEMIAGVMRSATAGRRRDDAAARGGPDRPQRSRHRSGDHDPEQQSLAPSGIRRQPTMRPASSIQRICSTPSCRDRRRISAS
jgi:putative hemolysin